MMTWDFYHMEFKHSSNGRAEVSLRVGRKTRTEEYVTRDERITLTRDDLTTLHQALKAFADRERRALADMPL